MDKEHKLPPYVEACMDELTDCRIDTIITRLRENRERYPGYAVARQAIREATEALQRALGDQRDLLETLLEAQNHRDGFSETEIYRTAFLDGARVYHAFATHELPVPKGADNL